MEINTERDVKKIVVVGHVDHGKSTLLGRILLDTGRVPQEKIESVRKTCEKKGIAFEPAFFFDALQEEQEQGITIDTTRVNFDFQGHRFLLIDAPGHIEFLKNMTSGASDAEQGLLMVDAVEGIRAQTSRHMKILSILGIREIIIAVNKLDKTGYDRARFETLEKDLREMAQGEGLTCLSVLPISALKGENVTEPSENMSWCQDPPLLQLLCKIKEETLDFSTTDEPLRMVLQDVYKFNDERYFAGRVLSGSVKPGDEVFFSPSGKVSTVKSIESYPQGSLESATKGDSIALCLNEQIFVERGELISFRHQAPEVETEFRAKLVWLSPEKYEPEFTYLLKIGTKETKCTVRIAETTDKNSPITNGAFAEVVIKADQPVAFDRGVGQYGIDKLVLCTPYETVAAGILDARPVRKTAAPIADPNVVYEEGYIGREARERRQGHPGAVLWMTGLSGAGKSTLAKSAERQLFNQGYRVVVLDGDNLRTGLNADLGFTKEDRAENIRRFAHVAKLFLDNGFIVLVAVISPYEKDRTLAKEIIGEKDFNEIFVFCPLEVCQERDPKGLYRKVKTGQVANFTGMGSPYQPPSNPSLRLDSSKLSTEEEVDQVVELLARKGIVQTAGESEITAGSEEPRRETVLQ